MPSGNNDKIISDAHQHTIKKFELIETYIKSWAQKLMLFDSCRASFLLIVCATAACIKMMKVKLFIERLSGLQMLYWMWQEHIHINKLSYILMIINQEKLKN